MAGLQLDYKIKDREAQQMLEQLGKFNARVMFEDVGGYLDSEVQRRFDEQEDWEGNQLEPSLRAIEQNGKTLIDYGHLRDSYTHIVFLDGKGVEQGTDVIYAAIHHFGGETGRGKKTVLPARPVQGINDDDEVEILEIVHEHYKRLLQP